MTSQYDEVSKRATMRYLAKLKEYKLRVKPDEFEKYERASKAQGYQSIRQFILAAIEEKISRG